MSNDIKLDFFINQTLPYINLRKPCSIDFYHLIILLEGKCTYFVNGEKIEMNKNDALLLTPGTHRERLRNSDYTHIVVFNFYVDDSTGFSNTFFKNSVNLTIKKLLDIYPYKTFILLPNSSASSDITKQSIVLRNILNCILVELSESLNCQSENHHIIKILNFINNNITRPITLNDVSQSIHLSKEYTARLFKKEMGMTVSEYINKQKLALAKDMLENNSISLKAIANNLGYDNYTYFTQIFKETFGISPQKMRNEFKKNN